MKFLGVDAVLGYTNEIDQDGKEVGIFTHPATHAVMNDGKNVCVKCIAKNASYYSKHFVENLRYQHHHGNNIVSVGCHIRGHIENCKVCEQEIKPIYPTH